MAAFEKELADYEGITCIPFSALKGEGTEELRDIVRQVCEDDEE